MCESFGFSTEVGMYSGLAYKFSPFFVCPPAVIGAFALYMGSLGVSIGTYAAIGIHVATEYFTNKEFNEQTVIDELLIEEEENFGEK